ncbi:hypothetical protein BS47DRAFT_1363353 [Hydnum rufescens UP504]|uniref:Uncharacterized protein n=1 Tax=Hydnum rufescens UP504 TaxID=1448309 RepID=A0A9P6AUF2_9AGAM|nr:hypothetical protein BS47DRAFT_1363353 [Hydnum rufescens UP504]
MATSVDEDFLFALFDFSKVKGSSWETPDVGVIPVRLSLSFVRTEQVNAEEKWGISRDGRTVLTNVGQLVLETPLALVLSSLTITLGNTNEAQLQLDAVGIKDAWMSAPSLLDRVISCCRQEVLSNCPVSNPGRRDNGNNQLGLEIMKVLLMFLVLAKKGLASTTLGSSVAATSFCSKHPKKNWGRPSKKSSRFDSLSMTVRHFRRSPSESGGAFGFFKRVGKGRVGSIDLAAGEFGRVVPKSIVFDVASSVSEGIRNATIVFDKP